MGRVITSHNWSCLSNLTGPCLRSSSMEPIRQSLSPTVRTASASHTHKQSLTHILIIANQQTISHFACSSSAVVSFIPLSLRLLVDYRCWELSPSCWLSWQTCRQTDSRFHVKRIFSLESQITFWSALNF